MLYTMKSAFSHLLIPKQILISPFAVYSGLVIYYAIGEIPRAYGSCMMGVEQASGLVDDFTQNLVLFVCKSMALNFFL